MKWERKTGNWIGRKVRRKEDPGRKSIICQNILYEKTINNKDMKPLEENSEKKLEIK